MFTGSSHAATPITRPSTASTGAVNDVCELFCGEESRIDRSIYLPAGNGKPTLPILRPMALRIVHYNNPVLRTKGEKVTVFDGALFRFAEDMIEAMHDAVGIGLAAQQ